MNRILPAALFIVTACMSAALHGGSGPADINRAGDIDTWIDLGGADRATAVLCPDQPVYLQAAEAIAAAIEKLGGQRPAVTCDPGAALPETHHVIALGNVNNNQLIARLYFNHYAYEDSLLPGAGGYSIRTVYDPYPWHGKGHVIVLGVSDDGGAADAAAKLVERIRRGKTGAGMDYTLEVSTAPPLSEAQVKALEAEQTPSFHVFLTSASQYLKTGREPYARHAIATLRRIVDLYAKVPDHDCDWPEETSSAEILATWDAFEECPLMTEAERRQFTLVMLRFMRTLVRHVSGYSHIGTDDLVTWNHTTFPLLGLYFGSRYFDDYYGLAEAKEHLEKARACMLSQARSWKPQEDADGYLTITMRHTIQYCLAEWNLEFFESGRMRQYADYVIGICDSSGLPSGFGDSGMGRRPALIEAALPVAFWWYRDPGYLWVLQHVHDGSWPNPFHRDIAAKEPDRHTGVHVFPLDAQLYEYTKHRSFYGEPLAPPQVPPEAAVDKIAFRESWDRNAQYLLLDGYSRGKHLHYDGGAIIELVDRGQRWLIDHDYLARNTTEHNMLSVIRDGRSTQLVPSCAGVLSKSDVGRRIGLVATEVPDYCGIDWDRYLFWRKGDTFVVMDRMTARQGAGYDLDLVWKVEDRGDEKLLDEGTFMVRRSAFPCRSQHARVVADPTASGGKAVLLGQGASVLSFVVELPVGEYGIAVRAYGMDTGSDSLFVASSAGEEVMVGVPHLNYGPDKVTRVPRGIPRLKLTGRAPTGHHAKRGRVGRRQLISVRLRERPPVRVDKFIFFAPGGEACLVVEAEEATPPTEDDIAAVPAQRFWVKWPDPVQLTVKRSTPKGMVVPVRKLYQRASRRLSPGETAEVANLLYTDETMEPADYGIQRIGSGAVLQRGEENALCAVRGAKLSGLAFDADMLYLSPSRVAWANGRWLQCGQARLTSAGISNLEIDLSTSEIVAESPDGQTVRVEAGGISPDLVARLLDSLADGALETSARVEISLPEARAVWTATLEDETPVRRLKLADLDHDGKPEILVASGNYAFALDGDGHVRWSYPLEGACHDLEAGELVAKSEGLEVAVAGGDTFAHLVDASGKLISKHQIRGPVWNQNFGDRPWEAYTVAVRDLNRDGRNEIILGTENYELQICDAEWRQLSRERRAVLHGSIDFLTVDADLDGKLEIFATDHYGRVQAFRHDGSKAAAFYTSIGDMQATLADLDGDGRVEVIYGSSTGDLLCTKLPETGSWQRGAKTLWRFDNFGYGVNRLRSADVDSDGDAEVVVASQTGCLFVLDGDGRVKWQDRAGTEIVEALVLRDEVPRLAYFDHSGVLCLATGDGKVRKRIALHLVPITAVQLGNTVVVGTADKVLSFEIGELWKRGSPVAGYTQGQ